MIKYDPGNFGLLFILRIKGSVFPKAMVWAIPNAILAAVLHTYFRQSQDEDGEALNLTNFEVIWAGYTSVLGFLVVFRNNQAYTRFWEGATLINQVRGEWFNAVSTLFAFCNNSNEEKMAVQVEAFQNTLVRLTSMLYCSALQQVCALRDDTLEILDNHGMDQESLTFMYESNDRCEILLQWIQRLIVDNEELHVIKIAPPLLTRAFQELSRGIVNLNNARKIKDIPFPFPYAQMITVMLVVHWVVTPLLASQVIESTYAASIVCFFVTFAFWCLIYIALEIDQPFGEDENDLPLREMQKDFNASLMRLMHPLAQKVPTYEVPTYEAPTDEAPCGRLAPSLSRSSSNLMRGSMVHRGTVRGVVEGGLDHGYGSTEQLVPLPVVGMVSASGRARQPQRRPNYIQRIFRPSMKNAEASAQVGRRSVRVNSDMSNMSNSDEASRGGCDSAEVQPPLEPRVSPIPNAGQTTVKSHGGGTTYSADRDASTPEEMTNGTSEEVQDSSRNSLQSASRFALQVGCDAEAGLCDLSGVRRTERAAV